MLITDMAYRDMEARSDSVTEVLSRIIGSMFRRKHHGATEESTQASIQSAPAPQIHLVATAKPEQSPSPSPEALDNEPSWRKHPMLRATASSSDLSEDELARITRAASSRAIFLARSGRLDEACDAFATVAQNADADLSDIPGFWNLSRAGMQSAIQGYELVERFRDAARLEATIRLKYRPRLTPVAIHEPRSASGN